MQLAPLTDAVRWQAVLDRDRNLDGSFVYAVRSTGGYCRTGCPSRRPRRKQVEFFPLPAAAEQAGYRACRRCHPREAVRRHPHVDLAERACRALDAAGGARLTLAGLAHQLSVSAAHLQRVFSRTTGISPKAYADAVRAGRLRSALRSGETVSRALYGAGYGSPSRVYEGRGRTMGMTPATYRQGGAGMQISYTTVDSPLGKVLVAATARGLCFVSLADSDRALERALSAEFPKAERTRADQGMDRMVRDVLARLSGRVPHAELPLDIQATAFQRAVWQALQRIPAGQTVTYAELAARIGKPKAVRAVASACASNNVAVVIPCHRVVRSDGGLGGYRWGVKRKQELLRVEAVSRKQGAGSRK
jgi:AraC family transcriptional regulator of adaptative response/methylated-DNA-[protein]-cysteine methyltransferase